MTMIKKVTLTSFALLLPVTATDDFAVKFSRVGVTVIRTTRFTTAPHYGQLSSKVIHTF